MGNLHSKALLTDPSQLSTGLRDSKPESWKTYDYVIVGGGTAGCVLASRLSDNPEAVVLLVEAGNSHEGEILSSIPFGFSKIFKRRADWNFNTTPQHTLLQREIYVPRGKILGGSSSTNALINHHCSPEDFDNWARNGASGWGYNNLRPYFLRSECYTSHPTYLRVDSSQHGQDGPLKVTHLEASPVNKILLDTCQNLGIPRNEDFNTPRGTLGAGAFAATVDAKGQRSSTATAYLTPEVLARSNLVIVVNCLAERLLFDDNNRLRAIGIEISSGRDSPKYRVRAHKEVILTAGAIGTPHLLLVSGVGPEGELKSQGVRVVKNLSAVGKNLYDHISIGSLILRAKPNTTWDYLNTPLHGFMAFINWMINGKGPLGTLPFPGAAFIRSTDSSLPFESKGSENIEPADLTAGPNSPDIEITWTPAIALNLGFTKTPSGLNGITISGISLKPESSGQISLKSSDIWEKPEIDANFFGSENDMNVALRSARIILRLAHTEPLASMLDLQLVSEKPKDSRHPFFWPGDCDPDKVTDEELKHWIRNTANPAWHPTSSCRMGESELTSVVDFHLRVRGIDGLRIVDASVFPTALSGHPCAAVVAIAERAADLIRSGNR